MPNNRHIEGPTITRHFVAALAFAALVTAAAVGQPSQPPIYVNAAATGANDGSSWSNAYTSLYSALSSLNDRPVWVARGVYKVSVSAFSVDTRSAFGGFAGTESDVAQRDIHANETILSGDLLDNDGADFTGYEENAPAVVVVYNGLLDGFTVRGASVLGARAGIATGVSTSRFINCTFRDNLGTAVDFSSGGFIEQCLF